MKLILDPSMLILFTAMLYSCITVQVPMGDAINSTKDWINEERKRNQQQDQAELGH